MELRDRDWRCLVRLGLAVSTGAALDILCLAGTLREIDFFSLKWPLCSSQVDRKRPWTGQKEIFRERP
jgi:hypothetical protein